MRLEPRRLAAFLADPGPCRVVLFHGEDAGLIRTRSDTLVRSVAGTTDDPFRILELNRATIGALKVEALAAPLTGGRRVIRIREAADWTSDHLRDLLSGLAAALVVLESNELPARSRLRSTVEAAKFGAAIACNALRGHQLEAALQEMLAERGVEVDVDAARWICGQIASDYSHLERTAETLALYAGPGGTIDLAEAMACVGDYAGLALEDALLAMIDGRLTAFDRALSSAFEDGQTAISALRAAIIHLQRLLRAREARNNAAGEDESARALPSPVSWTQYAASRTRMETLTGERLRLILSELADSERACKRTGAPAETICRDQLLQVARGTAR